MDHDKIRDAVFHYYNVAVAAKVADYQGTSDIPDAVVKMTIGGKEVTRSEIENFKDAVQCYEYILNQKLVTKSSGATSAGTLVAEPTCLYIPFNADIMAFDPFGKMSIFDEIELVLLSETAGKKQPYVGHVMKAARIIMSPVKLSNFCMALVLTYNDYSFNRIEIDPETGNKKGTVETYSVNFQTGKKG